ncbi:hypothetical protein BDF21DRAFT_403654 [Thamnidium elegans]|nr:hypothetical protein BDF21DRAFT_403654 [Thamnidium elegans]
MHISEPSLQEEKQELVYQSKKIYARLLGDSESIIKNICICVTDYASLTNDPNDLYNTLKLFKSVKEIAIDLGDKVEVFERYKLLRDRNNTALRKFKCRTGSAYFAALWGDDTPERNEDR